MKYYNIDYIKPNNMSGTLYAILAKSQAEAIMEAKTVVCYGTDWNIDDVQINCVIETPEENLPLEFKSK